MMNAREIRQAELEGEIENATQALQNHLSEYKDKGGNALIILGIIASAYLLYKLLADSEDENTAVKNVSNQGGGNFLRNALVGIVTSVAVGFAKNQILSLIDQVMNQQKEN